MIRNLTIRLAMRVVIAFMSPTMAHADPMISGTTFNIAKLDTSYYTYDPKSDITAPELSEVIKILLPALACRNIMGCDIKDAIKAAPENVKRHFIYHDR